MNRFLLNLLILIIFLSFSQKSFGQLENSLNPIKIDSICNAIDNNTNFSEGISEGTILNKRKKIIGGFSTYSLTDKIDNGILFRIRHQYSLKLYNKHIFYYYNKQLIKALIIIENWNNKSNSPENIYTSIYYFYENKPIKIIGEDLKYSNSEKILKQGLEFQNDYYKEQEELKTIFK